MIVPVKIKIVYMLYASQPMNFALCHWLWMKKKQNMHRSPKSMWIFNQRIQFIWNQSAIWPYKYIQYMLCLCSEFQRHSSINILLWDGADDKVWEFEIQTYSIEYSQWRSIEVLYATNSNQKKIAHRVMCIKNDMVDTKFTHRYYVINHSHINYASHLP